MKWQENMNTQPSPVYVAAGGKEGLSKKMREEGIAPQFLAIKKNPDGYEIAYLSATTNDACSLSEQVAKFTKYVAILSAGRNSSSVLKPATSS